MRKRKRRKAQMCLCHLFAASFLTGMYISVAGPAYYPCHGRKMLFLLNETADELNRVSLSFNGKQVVTSTNVSSMRWTDIFQKSYEERLYMKNDGNLTVILKTIIRRDEGLYRIAWVLKKTGFLYNREWNVTVARPPSINGRFTTTSNRTTGSNVKLTCGSFASRGHPEVSFEWNVSSSNKQSIIINDTKAVVYCEAVGEAVKCQDKNLTAVYEVKLQDTRTDSGSKIRNDVIVGGVISALLITAVALIIGVSLWWKGRKEKNNTDGNSTPKRWTDYKSCWRSRDYEETGASEK